MRGRFCSGKTLAAWAAAFRFLFSVFGTGRAAGGVPPSRRIKALLLGAIRLLDRLSGAFHARLRNPRAASRTPGALTACVPQEQPAGDGGIRRRARSTRSGAGALVFVLTALALAAPAEAQTTVTLLSNTGQALLDLSIPGSNKYAQGFSTGTHAAGYNLASIEVVVGTQNPHSHLQPGCPHGRHG